MGKPIVTIEGKPVLGEILILIGAVLIAIDIDKIAVKLFGQLSWGHLLLLGIIIVMIGIGYNAKYEKKDGKKMNKV